MRLLVVEDEPKMAGLLKRGLEREGYAVDLAANGAEALWATTEVGYDAVLLDAMIPEPDGYDVCRTLRDDGRWMPVLMLTARDGVADRVRGLDSGADDYLTKPFAFAELFARVRALVRRGPRSRPSVLSAGDLRLDPARRYVARGATEIELSPKEFALLELLLRHQGDGRLAEMCRGPLSLRYGDRQAIARLTTRPQSRKRNADDAPRRLAESGTLQLV